MPSDANIAKKSVYISNSTAVAIVVDISTSQPVSHIQWEGTFYSLFLHFLWGFHNNNFHLKFFFFLFPCFISVNSFTCEQKQLIKFTNKQYDHSKWMVNDETIFIYICQNPLFVYTFVCAYGYEWLEEEKKELRAFCNWSLIYWCIKNYGDV